MVLEFLWRLISAQPYFNIMTVFPNLNLVQPWKEAIRWMVMAQYVIQLSGSE